MSMNLEIPAITMKLMTLSLRWTLAFALTLGSAVGHSEEAIGNPSDWATQKMEEQNSAPNWVKRLRATKIGAYFQSSVRNKTELTIDEKARLTESLGALESYFDQDDRSGDFKNLMRDSVAPFVNALTRAKLLSHFRLGVVTEPIANWTLENFLVRQMVAFYAGSKNRVSQTLDIIKKHGRGMTIGAALFILGVSIVYFDRQFNSSGISDSVLSSLSFAWKSGPVTIIMTALTAWFMGPTTEFLTTWMNRIFGRWQALINKGYNWISPNIGSEEAQADANIKPRSATLDADGSTFAGQTDVDQQKNWQWLIDVMVAIQGHAPKLLRGAQGIGRSYLMGGVMDAQVSANFVYVMDTNLSVLNVLAGQVLQKYETRFFNRDENDKIVRLKSLYKQYEKICTRGWTEVLDDAQEAQLREEFVAVNAQLRDLGVMEHDLEELWNIQIKRSRAVNAMVSGITVNEFKRQINPETNRNAVPEARDLEAATYRGFELQSFVQNYELLVRRQQKAMKLENNGGEPAHACQSLLVRRLAFTP